jgi:parallel beta-helix repeat protein
LHQWEVANTIPIRTIDEENHVITMVDGVKDFNTYPWFIPTPIGSQHRFYVENILEELYQPGEWCLDTEEGILYFWPPSDSIGESDVTVPVLDCLIDLRSASWITISGFTFTETTNGGDNMHREGYEGYGAMFPSVGKKYCGEALRMRGTEHCCIENSHFYAVGGNGIYLEDYNARNVIRNNEISYAGACGVVMIGSQYFHPFPHHPVYNQVEYNHIHHCGVFDKYVAGVFLGVSDGNIIGHNLIEYMPHHAINLGNSGFGRNFIEYNEIHHICLETYDNGAINMWMEDPQSHCERDTERSGHFIRYNIITDIRGCMIDKEYNLVLDKENAHGIYLDNFTSNCFVYGNIVARCTIGIVVNGGKNNVIENNIVVDSRYQFRTWSPSEYWASQMGDFMVSNRFCRNIFYLSELFDGHLYLLYHWTDRVIGQSDYNLFFNANTGQYNIHAALDGLKILPIAEWQKMGYDTYSVIADPLFVDPTHDDYRLRPESPAFKLGFVPIDTAKIGIRDDSKLDR